MRKIAFLFLVFTFSQLSSQVIISPNPAAVPNASAMLEMDTQSKGMLIPRMTAAARKVIAAPAEGLWVYQTDENPGYFIFSNALWLRVAKDRALPGRVVFNDVSEAIAGFGGFLGYSATYSAAAGFEVTFATPFNMPPTVVLSSEALPAPSGVDPDNYCAPIHTQNCVPFPNADYLDIVRIQSCPGGSCVSMTATGPVSFANNGTGCNNTPNNYVNYFDAPNTIQATLYGVNTATGGSAGSFYNISMASGQEWKDNLFAWIDWNQDGDFLDAQEIIFEHYFSEPGSTNNPAWAAVITDAGLVVPSAANNGVTLLRAMSRFVTTIPNPCGTFAYGETQDYKILVAGASGASTAEPRASNCNVSSVSVSGFKVNCTDVISGAKKGTNFDFYATEY